MTEKVVRLNGVVTPAPQEGARLLDWLRETSGETSAKEGCGMGQCGACTVLIDGQPAPSCCVLVHAVLGRDVWTSSGLTAAGVGRTVLEKFAEHDAFQCGYCAPGMTVSAVAWLASRADDAPTRSEVAAALSGNVCRCTGYAAFIDALLSAAQSVEEPPA